MVNKQDGFTLIELVIAMGIVVALAMQTIQLGKNWIDDSFAKRANISIQTGSKLAKSLALRNKLGNSIGASFLITPSSVCVISGPVTLINCTSGYTWIDSLNATVLIGNAQYACIAYDNTGIAIKTAFCSTGMSYTINRGNKSVQGSI